MGDILHALPAVTALRLAHPDWHMGWVVEPRWKALLTTDSASVGRGPAQPLVDRVHFAPAKEWGRRPLTLQTVRAIRALRRELRGAEYDAVIDFQGAVRSAWIACMAGSGRVIGEDQPREWAARWLFTDRVKTQGVHVIEQDLEVASAVTGERLMPVLPLLPIDSEAEGWCNALLASTAGQPVALINPGAGWGAKRWPAERYAAVARSLIERGLRVVVNAGPGEESLAETIQAGTGGQASALTPSLQQLIALTRRIALCIAGDTGPLHLACALGRPVVGIYGPTDPSRNGPFRTQSAVLRSPESRRDHSRRAEPEAAMLTIQPDEVLRAAFALLDGESER